MKSIKQLITEADPMQSQLMMFKRLLDQIAKTPQEKVQAMTTLANLVLGPQDVKQLSKALVSPPPLPGSQNRVATASAAQTTAPATTLASTQS